MKTFVKTFFNLLMKRWKTIRRNIFYKCNEHIYMAFTTEGFFEVAIES